MPRAITKNLKVKQPYLEMPPGKGEKQILDWIRSLGLKAGRAVLRDKGQRAEIDVAIKDLKVGIEFNGDYWHSEANKAITPKYHLNKTLIAEANGWKLIHIFEHEWAQQQDICKSFIKAALGLFDVKLMARKCELKEVEASQANDFFQAYHFQGRARTEKAWGLFWQNELVACASFSKPHRQNMKQIMHLSRFVCKPGYQITGGLSRLAAAGKTEYKEIISFVHRRLSDGKSYEAAGFKKEAVLRPDYWYWDHKNKVKVSKQSRQRSMVNTPIGMSESEHARADGLLKVWDCGKIRYRL